jgi:hypothetical protein
MAMNRLERNGNPQEFAGNNCFHLRTIDDNKNVITLTGILKEMPSFGLSTEWTEAPRATFGKKIQEFFMSDLVNTASFLSGGVNTTQLLNDEWSSRMYAGTTNKDLTLNFRIYPQNTLGQTDPNTWLENLSKYATSSGASTLNLGTLEQNILNTLSAAKSEGNKIGTELSNLTSNTAGDAESEHNQKERKERIYRIDTRIEEFLTNAINDVKPVFINTMSGQKIEDWTGKKAEKEQTTLDIETIINGVKIEITSNENYSSADDVELDDNVPFKFHFEWAQRNGGSSEETVDAKTFDTTTCQLDVDSIIDGLTEDSDWEDENQQVVGMDHVRDYFRAVLENINKQIRDGNLDFDANFENIKTNHSALVELEKTLASKYATEDRWNEVDFLAARLWQLDIFRFIFKKPIIVAITDWKVTPSLEMMGSQHAYYDFSITCRPDQIKSLPRWKDIIKYEPQPKVD